MAEGYWERKRRHLADDHAFRRRESAWTLAGIEAEAGIASLTAAVGDPGAGGRRAGTVTEEFRRLGVEWAMSKSAILDEIATNPDLDDDTRGEWRHRLEAITLTDAEDAPLAELAAGVRAHQGRFLAVATWPALVRLGALAERLGELAEVQRAARAAL